MSRSLVVFGLSLSSSWGNGHAATFRGLLRALAEKGWSIAFFERDLEWYRANRDLADPDFCDLLLYEDWSSVQFDAALAVKRADVILVGSFVPDGATIIDWLAGRRRPLFFYDIDTPITLEKLRSERATEYVRADQISLFDTYFSFAGGPALEELESRWCAARAEALYCGVDTTVYRPVEAAPRFACLLSYLGTYAADRQPALEEMFLAPAAARPNDRFLLAGAQFPPMRITQNVARETHVYQRDHAALYGSSTATLNLTRKSMRRYGWAPSTRLFEAGACGTCIISDVWPGINSLFEPDTEILLAQTRSDVMRHLDSLTEERRACIGAAAQERVLREHTYQQRARQVDAVFERALSSSDGKQRWANVS